VLLAVGTVFGAWTVVHALAHEAGHGAGEHAAPHSHAPLAFAASHGHGHAHPELEPVVLTAKVQVPIAPSSAPAFVEPGGASVGLRMRARAVRAHAAPGLAGPSAPRAPPIA
jgi:hypothetical protein